MAKASRRRDRETEEPAAGVPSATATAPEGDEAVEGVAEETLAAEGALPEEGGVDGDSAPTEPVEASEGDESASDEGETADAPAARRKKAAAFPPPPAERLEGAVEALLLAAGESLSDDRIRDLLGLPSAVHVKDAVEAVRARWGEARLPVEIQDVAGGRRVVTRPEYAEYVGRLHRKAAADRLSKTLLETLSIVAYRQPVARAEIERVRGVQSGDALRGLLDRRLVKVSGRSDQPGRPLLYATTTRFLEVFGLASLADLPNAKDLVRL